MRSRFSPLFLILVLGAASVSAGPFTEPGLATDDPSIIAWATGWLNYQPADSVDPDWSDPTKALGPATSDVLDVVSLGDRDVTSVDPPGEITLTFDVVIQNRPGNDLVIFENGFAAGAEMFAELAYVEVSSDGENWARFPSVSLTPECPGQYNTLNPTDVYGLAGRYPNAYNDGFGAPFDLEKLLEEPEVLEGLVDLDHINYIKIVDVPGGGNYFDEAVKLGYTENHPIYDAYPTITSAGFDVEAVGVVDESVADKPEDDDTENADDDDDDDASPAWKDDDDAQDASSGGCGAAK